MALDALAVQDEPRRQAELRRAGAAPPLYTRPAELCLLREVPLPLSVPRRPGARQGWRAAVARQRRRDPSSLLMGAPPSCRCFSSSPPTLLLLVEHPLEQARCEQEPWRTKD
ncbi:hypothetical protein PR202_gb13820 [Eleusine coracana subsp. coracana]|uniref:Uncharacterized protein n=1 Tax=Eleusine coracana subsp. coracana TaxID=191504 RepID=A0AAV5ER80_ELECO|nr:hypothetical protein PR202_gb13820 [Eleusine coracana subsp. coracana]